MNLNVVDYSKASIHNRSKIKDTTECGCYFCLNVCKGKEITEWIDDEDTALCPTCKIDSLLPGISNRKMLEKGAAYWFTRRSAILPSHQFPNYKSK